MSEPRISVLCPTRNRPESVCRLVQSSADTASGSVEFVFYVDDDDRSFPTEFELPDFHVRVVRGPRIVLSEMWNRCAEVASADVLMHCGDDIVFRTKGWDDKVLAEFAKYPDKIVLVYGDDGCNPDIATHGFYHRRWMETVGYFCPPYFSSDYNDTWLTEVADMIGRRRKIDIYTEHMHPVANKGVWDQTHQERLVRHKRDNVEALYASKAPEREADAEKLRAVIAQFPVWEILIATLGQRGREFQSLMHKLLPQVDAAQGRVRVTALWNNAERPLACVRQDLLDGAQGQYVSFVDDDDDVPAHFVSTILPLLDGVDYVGWRMQCWSDGRKLQPTFHSLKHNNWWDDDHGFYRDLSHLNPVRRDLAQQASFRIGGDKSIGEDRDWVGMLRDLNVVKTEHYIDKVMYYYQHSSQNSVQKPKTIRDGVYLRPEIDNPHFRFHPASLPAAVEGALA